MAEIAGRASGGHARGMTASQGAERPYHHGDLRAAVLTTGRRLLDQRDGDDISLREIAREVGVTAPSVYRYFPEKAALLRALAHEGLKELAEAQRIASAAAGGGRDGFTATGEAYVAFAVKNPALFRLIYAHPPRRDPMTPEWGSVSPAMALLLESSARFAPEDMEAKNMALHSWAVVHGLAMLVLAGQVRYDPAAIRAAIRVSHPAP